MANVAYCIRCKQKQEIVNGELVYYKNGTPVEKGKCAVCDCTITRIYSRAERQALKDKQIIAENNHEA